VARTSLAPAVVTGAASSIGPNTATLDGTVNPRGQVTVYSFQYGTTTAYGSSTPSFGAGSGTVPAAVSAGLSGLAANTVYHYRLMSTNQSGTTFGADRTFTTSAAGGGGGGGGTGGTAPALLALRVSPARFVRSGRRSGGHCRPVSRTNRSRPRCRRPLVLRVGYTLSLPARVTFTLKQARPGRLVRGRCVRPTHANRKRRRCRRWLALHGSLTRPSPAGASSFIFTRLPGRRALGPGSYELIATATTGGRTGRPLSVTFQIVP
jgi:hypothetical protein